VRLTVLLTTPRLPGGLLTGVAWRAIFAADRVLTAEPTSALARAVEASEVPVTAVAGPTATALLAEAADSDVVWLTGADGDEDLTAELAADVVRRSESGEPGPEVEILLGAFDPPGARLLDLVAVMDRLRRECPWDQEQTHESLVRYLLEECYETIEAIEAADRDHLREELGDLLLQVMFHSRIAEEDPDEPFDIDDVAGQIVEKLVRRHPHVFADVTVESAQDVNHNWETIKAAEKSRDSAMDGIPPGLPALAWADQVVGRAVTSGLVTSVPIPAQPAYTAQTLGEVLFALVAAARVAGIDPEQALRRRVRAEIEAVRLSEAAEVSEPADVSEVSEVPPSEGRALPDEPAAGG
jgi:XTP/dITP diphosphohydrolase